MARAVQRTAARRDFIIHYAYLLEHAGLDVAKQFREAVEQTMPNWRRRRAWGLQARVRLGKHSLVRLWRVRAFDSYIIAYLPHRVGVAIERLVHAKQDYQRILR